MTFDDGAARVQKALEARRMAGQKALVGFLTAGYPDWTRFDGAVAAFEASGVDVLELGVPFSDPLADGPTIQRSSQAALAAGVHLRGILEHVRARASSWRLPVVLMSYVNPLLAYGVSDFARDAVEAGVAGVLLSDLPPEELPDLWGALHQAGLETPVLVAPTTRLDRLPALARAASGFLYCVSRTGVTGRGAAFAANLQDHVRALRGSSDLPLLVGFGVRTPEDAAAVGRYGDGVIVGARLIEVLEGAAGALGAPGVPDAGDGTDPAIDELRSLLTAMRRAMDRA